MAPQIAADTADIESLKIHPRNYRNHPEDQLAHIKQSILDNGIYRPIVVARDNTILAGHGVVEAATSMGIKQVPIIRVDLAPDDPKAIKILTGDNEISKLAHVDDRLLTELLKELNETDLSLLGTGFDEMQLANLVMVTRPASEVASFDAAAEWIGMPEHSPGDLAIKLIFIFRTTEDRDQLLKDLEVTKAPNRVSKTSWSMWWPQSENEDLESIGFEVNEAT